MSDLTWEEHKQTARYKTMHFYLFSVACMYGYEEKEALEQAEQHLRRKFDGIDRRQLVDKGLMSILSR